MAPQPNFLPKKLIATNSEIQFTKKFDKIWARAKKDDSNKHGVSARVALAMNSLRKELGV